MVKEASPVGPGTTPVYSTRGAPVFGSRYSCGRSLRAMREVDPLVHWTSRVYAGSGDRVQLVGEPRGANACPPTAVPWVHHTRKSEEGKE